MIKGLRKEYMVLEILTCLLDKFYLGIYLILESVLLQAVKLDQLVYNLILGAWGLVRSWSKLIKSIFEVNFGQH